jgi:hypothetical protein
MADDSPGISKNSNRGHSGSRSHLIGPTQGTESGYGDPERY